MKNNAAVGTKIVVIGSTGNKYNVSKSKGSKVWDTCSCNGWTKHMPRKNCRHIKSALMGIFDTRKNDKLKKEETPVKKTVAKVVVKASVNVKKASEVIYKLIAKTPGKLTRISLREKTQLAAPEVKSACEYLWAAKRITRGRSKKGWLKGAYIPVKANA